MLFVQSRPSVDDLPCLIVDVADRASSRGTFRIDDDTLRHICDFLSGLVARLSRASTGMTTTLATAHLDYHTLGAADARLRARDARGPRGAARTA